MGGADSVASDYLRAFVPSYIHTSLQKRIVTVPMIDIDGTD
jgi:hypothetical protein